MVWQTFICKKKQTCHYFKMIIIINVQYYTFESKMCRNSSTYKFLWAMKRNYKMNITWICNNLNLQLSRFHLLTTCSLRLHFTIRSIKVIINISQHNERLVHGKKKNMYSDDAFVTLLIFFCIYQMWISKNLLMVHYLL